MALFRRRRQRVETQPSDQAPSEPPRTLATVVDRAKLSVSAELEARRRGRELADLLMVTTASEWFDPEMREIRRQLDRKLRDGDFQLSRLTVQDLATLGQVLESIDRAARRKPKPV
ncbi:MAG: hypothetical protein KJ621_07345 [Proteobacteria bacterium]|nr:hypothetical protein [Pseudomonadota bacterium]MBU1740772.1 hypothetical protein [Pseudomonadota bacterium]